MHSPRRGILDLNGNGSVIFQMHLTGIANKDWFLQVLAREKTHKSQSLNQKLLFFLTLAGIQTSH